MYRTSAPALNDSPVRNPREASESYYGADQKLVVHQVYRDSLDGEAVGRVRDWHGWCLPLAPARAALSTSASRLPLSSSDPTPRWNFHALR